MKIKNNFVEFNLLEFLSIVAGLIENTKGIPLDDNYQLRINADNCIEVGYPADTWTIK